MSVVAEVSRAGEGPRLRGRPKVVSDEARREGLIELALEIFGEVGYERTSMDLVAARARISKQTLYRLFPGKSALFAAVVDRHRRFVLALPGDYDDLPMEEALAAIFRADIDAESYGRRMMLVEAVLPETARHPEIIETLRRFGADPAREELAAWLERQMEAGRIDRTRDAAILADILVHMIFGVSRLHTGCGAKPWPDLPDRGTLVRRCIEVFLNGVTPRR